MEIVINTHPKYRVLLQYGELEKGIGNLIGSLSAQKVAIITDSNVEKLYLRPLKESILKQGKSVCSYAFPAGEKSKTLQTVEKLYDFLCENNITRTDLIIALGGGVVGDTAGFVAATYLRGIKLVQIPTTLLAMVDSSIGGKTGINLKSGKNLAGSFYQPSMVVVDTKTLDTLPWEEWQNGIGEIIKYGAIKDKKLFELMEEGKLKERIEEVIFRCLNIKKQVVQKDTLDIGIRQILNFGHTLGHSIEKHSNYAITHGKAIGIGMVLMTKWAEERCFSEIGSADRIEKLLRIYNMPTSYDLSMKELWELATNDKKRKGNKITLVLIDEIGKWSLQDIDINKFLEYNFDAMVLSSFLQGKVIAPPSKSMAHRAIFCAILAKGTSTISNVVQSEDIQASIRVAEALGKKIERKNNNLIISDSENQKTKANVDCGESGTTFRFLLPILSALGKEMNITGKGRLGERPYDVLCTELEKKGASFDKTEGLPLQASGQLKSGEFHILGNVSSQYISGLLIALPILDGDSKIVLTTTLESSAYVDMTVECMKSFGVNVEKTDYGYFIKGSQKYKPATFRVEGDWSNAAFWLCAGVLNGEIEVQGLNENSLQGDKEIKRILLEMGGKIEKTPQGYKTERSELHGIDLDATEIPDLIPIVATVMSYAQGKSIIRNTQRLKLKECDRQKAIVDILTKQGVDIRLHNDAIEIIGNEEKIPASIDGHKDHRIVMSLAISAIKNSGTMILGSQAIRKSYPNFFLKFKKLGGKYVINMGE